MDEIRGRCLDPTRWRRAVASCLCLLILGAVAFGAQGEDDDGTAAAERYLGVKTCAGSTCHGAGGTGSDSRVLQNEFQTWHRKDKHAQAYQVLLDERGQRIARNLGIENPGAAPECLGCHATFVPVDKRGKRFALSDGVGCETCHGPASRWLGQHVTGEASRAENIAVGMYPTEEPAARAELCLSCHLGTPDRFATHRLMGAGHPRLSFELDTFTRIQPAHFRIDADYRARKRVASGMQVWAIGQVLAAQRFIDILLSDRHGGTGAFPEFAFFDCHACHHAFTEPRWQPRPGMALPPGTPHLNDSSLLMLTTLMRHVDEAIAARLGDAVGALHRASTQSMADTRTAAGALHGVLGEVEGRIKAANFAPADMTAVLRGLVETGISGEFRDFAAAEQSVMAIAALVDALAAADALDEARRTALGSHIDSLYAATADQNRYAPAQLIGELESLKTALD